MKNLDVPTFTFPLSSVVLGLMRIQELDDAQVQKLVGSALDNGINVFDHANVYGSSRHGCETRWGEAVHLTPSQRDSIVIQSKVGIREGFWDFSREHILAEVDLSLAALKTDRLDVLLLHRPDTLMEPDEIAAAFDELEAAGKVRHFGVSNQTPGQIDLLKTAVKQPLLFNQVQLSITHASLIAMGISANMQGLNQSIDRDRGMLDYSRLNGMTLQAWSPFQKGFFDGPFLGSPDYPELNERLIALAQKYGVTPTGIAVAWITRHPAHMQVVLGTTKPERVAESAAGADIRLTAEEWYSLFTAGGYVLP